MKKSWAKKQLPGLNVSLIKSPLSLIASKSSPSEAATLAHVQRLCPQEVGEFCLFIFKEGEEYLLLRNSIIAKLAVGKTIQFILLCMPIEALLQNKNYNYYKNKLRKMKFLQYLTVFLNWIGREETKDGFLNLIDLCRKKLNPDFLFYERFCPLMKLILIK